MSNREDRTHAESSDLIETREEIETFGEVTQIAGVEQNETEEQTQTPKKTPPRKPRKSASSTAPLTDSMETSPSKKTSAKRSKKNVELVSPASESVAEPQPQRTVAKSRSRKKPLEPASQEPSMLMPVEEMAPDQATTLVESSTTDTVEIAPSVEETFMASTPPVEPIPALSKEEPTLAFVEVGPVSESEVPMPLTISGETSVSREETPGAQPPTERRHLVKSAGLVSLGNLGSSLLGMVRQVVLAHLGSLYAGPFIAALTPANNFYQLLVNGAVSGALIPAFNDYAASEKRRELRHIVFTLVNFILIITLAAAIGYTLISPWFINSLLSQLPNDQRGLALQYSQIIFFSLLALGPFSILLAALYSLKEFGWPAFATAAYHMGIILGAVGVAFFGSHYLGSFALPVGVLVGAVGEVALLLPGIRNQQLYYMFVLDLKHPALRHIFKLYLPVFLGFLFTTGAVLLDLSLQSQTSEHSTAIAAMGFATTLIQFPVGLVAAALSFAVLPTLSEHVREGNPERFKQTLLLGFRLGLLLMIPAMVGLFALRTPITYLLFAHGKFGTSGADLTAVALQNYAYQLPFVALDQLLIAAFYARKNTKIPVIIGVVSIFFYLIVALPFYKNIGVPALAFANTMQNSMHALILLFLLRRAMGVLHIRTAMPALLKICLAAALMGLASWGVLIVLGHVALFSLTSLRGQLLTLIVAGGVASAIYFGAVLLLKVEEVHLLKGAVLAKLGKK